jgi:hypothetical protein
MRMYKAQDLAPDGYWDNMNTIDLDTFKQLVELKDGLGELEIEDVYYMNRLYCIYKELDELIMDIVKDESDSE